jgi:hypothetical protein
VTSGPVETGDVLAAASVHAQASPPADGTGDVPARAADSAETGLAAAGSAGRPAPALPRRIRRIPLAAGHGRTVQPPGPEILRQVLDGLNRL